MLNNLSKICFRVAIFAVGVIAITAIQSCAGNSSARQQKPPVTAKYCAYSHVVIPRGHDPTSDALARKLQAIGFAIVDSAKEVPSEKLPYALNAEWEILSSSMASSSVVVTLRDLSFADVIYEQHGSFGFGMSVQGDINGAVANALRDLRRHYAFHPELLRVNPARVIRTPVREIRQQACREGRGSMEGIWVEADDARYEVAIVRRDLMSPDEELEKYEYIGVILSSRNPLFTPGQLKFGIDSPPRNGDTTMADYLDARGELQRIILTTGPGSITAQLRSPDGSKKSMKYTALDIAPAVAVAASEGARGTSSGTGFCIGPNFIITNNHVVQGATSVSVRVRGRDVPAIVAACDEGIDLAILRVEDESLTQETWLPVATEAQIVLGSRLYVAGFPVPSALGANIKVTDGIVSSLSGLGNVSIFQISAPVQPGNSGGPVFDADGRILGVVVARVDDAQFVRGTGTIAQNINFAIKSSMLSAFLAAGGITSGANVELPASAPENAVACITARTFIVVSKY